MMDDDVRELPDLNKTFYDRGWSSIDQIMKDEDRCIYKEMMMSSRGPYGKWYIIIIFMNILSVLGVFVFQAKYFRDDPFGERTRQDTMTSNPTRNVRCAETVQMFWLLLLVVTARAAKRAEREEIVPCNHSTKQTALYVDYEWSSSDLLSIYPATSIVVEHIWSNVTDLRRFGENGVFAAHPIEMGTNDAKIGGYFGSQVDGSSHKGGLIWSIWDAERSDLSAVPNATWAKHRHAFPLSSSCKRHCLDCGLHPGWHNTTGVQCTVPLVMNSGEGVRFRLFRTAANRTLENPLGMNMSYVGDVWELVAHEIASGREHRVGTMFLEDVHAGLTRFGGFHEHIGCVPCSSFFESERRIGPYDVQPGNRTISRIAFHRPNVSCELFDVSVHNERDPPEVHIATGPGSC